LSYSVGIIIISDRAFSGERPDMCLPRFEKMLERSIYEISESTIINDDADTIEITLRSFVAKNLNLIFTSGGTGCAPRDNTPEATRRVIERLTPGVDEAIRAFSKEKAKFAIYSRATSGIAAGSFIVNLPGSPDAVAEILDFLLPTIEHPLKLLAGQVKDCQKDMKR